MMTINLVSYVVFMGVWDSKLEINCIDRRNSLSTGFWDCNTGFKVYWWSMVFRHG